MVLFAVVVVVVVVAWRGVWCCAVLTLHMCCHSLSSRRSAKSDWLCSRSWRRCCSCCSRAGGVCADVCAWLK